jgi:hypothetical protein
MTFRTLGSTLVCSCVLLADAVVLRSGRTIEGTWLGGDSRNIRIAVDDRVDSFPVSDVRSIRFGSAEKTETAPVAAPASSRSADQPMRREILRPDPAPTSSGREIPAGTSMSIRMIDDVDSERDSVGHTYKASIDEPVVVEGATVIPRGADVVVKLVDDQQSGKFVR